MPNNGLDPTRDPVILTRQEIGIGDDEQSLAAFQSFWDNLEIDPYVPAGPIARRRSFCSFVYSRDDDVIALLEHGPYFQEKARNEVYGGIQRSFAPSSQRFLAHPWLALILRFGSSRLLLGCPNILLRCHQVRISTVRGLEGDPSPEGMHADGFDFISIHLVKRSGCRGGMTTVEQTDGDVVLRRELVEPLESLFIDDRQFVHATSPISTSGRFGHRDVLLLSYEKLDAVPPNTVRTIA